MPDSRSAEERDRIVNEFLLACDSHGSDASQVQKMLEDYPFLASEVNELRDGERLLGRVFPVDTEGAADAGELPAGTTLGEFRIVRKVNSGGMGVIYEARQPSLERTVALKSIRPQRVSEAARLRFVRERKVLAHLHHSHVVAIFAAGSEGEVDYFAMPFIRGGSLRRVLGALTGTGDASPLRSVLDLSRLLEDSPVADDGTTASSRNADDTRPLPSSDPSGSSQHRAPVAEEPAAASADITGPAGLPLRPEYFRSVAQVMSELAATVQEVHDHGVLHRDINPNNVVVDTDGKAWLLDFGLAAWRGRGVDTSSATDDALLATSGHLGTPRYMAPEQSEGEAGVATDIWGLGTCLFGLLTLQDFRPPVGSESDPGIVLERSTAVPASLAAVCRRCLEPDPRNRYANAAELEEDLRRWLRAEPVQAKRHRPFELAALWCRRNPAKAVAFALLCLLSAVSAGLTFRARSSESAAVAARSIAEQNEQVANRQRQRAELAEADARQRLAESNHALARQSMQRGRWREALTYLDLASSDWTGPLTELQLDKAQTLLAVNDWTSATAILRRLESDPEAAEYLAEVKLVKADITLGIDNQVARRLIREARDLGLKDPVDRLYAEALLVEDSEESVRLLKEVVAHRPHHLRANQTLVMTLFMLGRRDELALDLAAAQAFYPEDPNFWLMKAMLAASKGDRAGALEILEGHAKQLGSDQMAMARLVINIFADLRDFDSLAEGDPWAVVMRLVPRVGGALMERLSAPSDAGEARADSPLILPPALENGYGWMRQFFNPLALFQFSQDKLTRDLGQAAEKHPDGLLFLLYGKRLVDRGRWEEAEEALRQAVTRPSMLNIRRTALRLLVRTQFVRSHDAEGDVRKALRRQSAENVQLLFTEYGARPERCRDYIQIALAADAVELARQIAHRWEEQAPDDVLAKATAGSVALSADLPFEAAEKLREALEAAPDHPEHEKWEADRDAALDKLRQAVARSGAAEAES